MKLSKKHKLKGKPIHTNGCIICETSQYMLEKRVRFQDQLLNTSSLDESHMERLQFNLKYNDDTIFEKDSIFNNPVKDFDMYFKQAEVVSKITHINISNEEELPPNTFKELNNSFNKCAKKKGKYEKILGILRSVSQMTKIADMLNGIRAVEKELQD